MTTFYTSCEVWGGKILYRGIENGKRVQYRVDYQPTLFVLSDKPSKFKTIHGEAASPIKFDSIKEARDFAKQYENVNNFKIYGNQRYQYCYISDKFDSTVDWNIDYIKVANIDIEVGSDNGFPDPYAASQPLTAITVKMDGKFTAFGCGEYKVHAENIVYIKCVDEFVLIRKFLGWWQSDYPDIVTGWNVENFDIVYLVNRITNLLGEKEANKLSPWNLLTEKTLDLGMGRRAKGYNLFGIATLDMMMLFKRYAPNGQSQESYRLDNIAHVVLGERKLSYEEFGSLHNLYKENYQRYLEYNVKDVDLVDKINQEGKFIELALTLSYDNKCNYEDVYAQVRMWDVICFHHLKSQNIVVPPTERHEKDEAYAGAYVKDPYTGFHNWVASFDVNSEYPSVIMGSNISPETIVEPHNYSDNMRNIIASGISVDRLLERQVVLDALKEHNVCLTANGQFYRRDKQGFMPELVEKMFNDRKVYKKAMLDAEQQLAAVEQEIYRRGLKSKI